MTITDILDFINKNPWLNILFLLLTILSLLLSIWFYLTSKKVKVPSYAVRTFNLVKDKIKKIETVEILYQGSKIDNLSISKIAVWNSGKETISRIDVAQNDKFRIVIEEGKEILDCQILFEKNSANGFNFKKLSPSEIEINFDYFDLNEGAIFQLYHTATESSSIILKGSFKGTKQIVRDDSSALFPAIFYKALRTTKVSSIVSKKVMGVMTIFIPFLLFYSLFFEDSKTDLRDFSSITKSIMLLIITIPYWWMGYQILRRRVPKGFNLFNNEF